MDELDFRLSDYIKLPRSEDKPKCLYGDIKCKMAQEWARDSLRTIIYPVATLRELETLWKDFEQMSILHRRQSDSKSVEIFGITNQDHYEKMKSEFLKDNIEDLPVEDEVEAVAESVIQDIFYTSTDIDNAINWSSISGYPIIYPTRNLDELEQLWDNFNSYSNKIRRFSDSESYAFFGVNNEDHYNYLKSQFLKQDISDVEIVEESFIGDAIISHKQYGMNESEKTTDRARDLLSLLAKKNENYEEALVQNIVDKTTGEYVASHQNLKYDIMPFEDLPFFTPEEMIDFGVNQANPEDNFYGCDPIANVISEDMSNWFDSYCQSCIGYNDGYDPLKWKNSVRGLILKRDMSSDEEKDQYNQAILNLGWPPEAEFSPENQAKASKRLKMKLADRVGSVQFVDLTGMNAEDISEAAAFEFNPILKPVFIILEEGKSLHSKVIKKVTNSEYTHAAISFDPSLKKFYSFGIEESPNGIRGGFIEEHIDDKDPDSRLGVYAIFLKEPDFKKLEENVKYFIDNIKHTSYSYIGLLTNLFRIPINMKKTMICSQFVDKMLKLVDIDLSKKQSSLVTPADYEKFAKENKKIYVLFNDFVSKFKPTRIKNLVKRLTSKAVPIKEYILWTDPIGIVFEMVNNIESLDAMQELASKINLDTLNPGVKKVYDIMIAPCLEAEDYFREAKELPVKFDKDGNLFIKNIKKRDYEGEYAKSHKLLRKYEESGNIEGMKYELCKLWMMNSVIESKLHSKKFNDLPSFAIETSKEHKARAKILNDFNHFLGVVLENEPNFNFEEYYSNSPFNDAMIKIDKDTVIWSGKIIKAIMKSL